MGGIGHWICDQIMSDFRIHFKPCEVSEHEDFVIIFFGQGVHIAQLSRFATAEAAKELSRIGQGEEFFPVLESPDC